MTTLDINDITIIMCFEDICQMSVEEEEEEEEEEEQQQQQQQ